MNYSNLYFCYQNVIKQRDEAECKVKSLTMLIDDVIYNELSASVKERVILELIKIGV